MMKDALVIYKVITLETHLLTFYAYIFPFDFDNKTH